MAVHVDPLYALAWLAGLALRIAVNFALVVLCGCALVAAAVVSWRRFAGAGAGPRAGAGEDVGLRGFRWVEEGDER
ncbi:hypothetical protein [Streptomyces sp. NPDC015131]|uniref:hypothetical protein n=1 Tax=Streptomyces sp. NPDC015131 TaxID=3364941 RepID=UPI0036F9725B